MTAKHHADLDIAAEMLAVLLPLPLQGQLDTLAVTIDAWVRTRGRDWWDAAVTAGSTGPAEARNGE